MGYHWWGRDTRELAIGWCHEVPFRLRLGLRLSQVMADDWVVPLAPLRLSDIIQIRPCCEFVVTSGRKIGTTHYLGSSQRVWLVTFPDQHVTRPCLADHVLGHASRSVIDEVDSSLCYKLLRPILSRPLSCETLVWLLLGRLWWLVNYVSRWGTTRMETCIL